MFEEGELPNYDTPTASSIDRAARDLHSVRWRKVAGTLELRCSCIAFWHVRCCSHHVALRDHLKLLRHGDGSYVKAATDKEGRFANSPATARSPRAPEPSNPHKNTRCEVGSTSPDAPRLPNQPAAKPWGRGPAAGGGRVPSCHPPGAVRHARRVRVRRRRRRHSGGQQQHQAPKLRSVQEEPQERHVLPGQSGAHSPPPSPQQQERQDTRNRSKQGGGADGLRWRMQQYARRGAQRKQARSVLHNLVSNLDWPCNLD